MKHLKNLGFYVDFVMTIIMNFKICNTAMSERFRRWRSDRGEEFVQNIV